MLDPNVLASLPSKHALIDGFTYISTAISCWNLLAPKLRHVFFAFVPAAMGFVGAMLQAGAAYLKKTESDDEKKPPG